MKLFKRLRKGVYSGPVCYVDGSHYPVGSDGHSDLRQRVLWNAEEEAYYWASPTDPTHAHLHERAVVEIPIQPTQITQ